MQYLIGLIPGVGGTFGRIGSRMEREKWEREHKQVDLCGRENTETVSGISNGDDNNTREKGIDVGIYVALCDFEKLNLCVTCGVVFVVSLIECQWGSELEKELTRFHAIFSHHYTPLPTVKM